MLFQAIVSAVLNIVILAAVPFLVYAVYHRWRWKRSLGEIAQRAGLQTSKLRYMGLCAIAAVIMVAALLVWPPDTEPFTREGSAQRDFAGLGINATAIAMAFLYGFIKTGFAEELLFRGLIAGSLSRRLPMIWANILQGVIFLLPHLLILVVMPELTWVLGLVMAGALFAGWIRIKSESILGPWLLHATVNVTICLSIAARTV